MLNRDVCYPLFSIYINGLLDEFSNLNCGINLNDKDVSILLYADDIALLAPDEQSMNKMLMVLHTWCEKWKLSINPDRTKLMHYRVPSRNSSKHVFKCGDIEIEYVKTYRYLVIWFDQHLD